MSVSSRMFLTMSLGNLGGALLTFVYFRYLDTSAHEGRAPLGGAEIGYFLASFSLLLLAGRMAARRWSRSLAKVTVALADTPANASLRRRAVMVPAFLAVLSLTGWVIAALLWGVVGPLLISGAFSPVSALRQSFGMVFVSGAMVALFIFLATERVWRDHLLLLFPNGDLTTTGARRLRVRTRMVVVFLMMSVLPMIVLSVATIIRVRNMQGQDAEVAAAILRNLILVQVVLVGVGVVLAVIVARFVADSVALPLRQLQSSMTRVEQGQLDVVCPVVSNDEIGAVTEGFNRMVAGLRERETIRETFGKYVSPQIRDEILAGRAELAGGQREVTILFADLRGFSTWAESSPPAEVVQGLNAYFTEMDIAIRAHGGLVLQYIGDEIEAVFGAPLPDLRHADHAVAAARDMQARLEHWNRQRRAAGQRELDHGIGIHTGTVLAGNIGSAERMSYALVGDAVNVASRIESLNKELGTHILVSGATRDLLSDVSALRLLETTRVKGRTAVVKVYRLA
ncbi:MAG: adenylate/guanylate cyclase domain-containing protein [Rhodoferax sp.]|nr:adenylate/guanylate cyclase domain-containing protein [Rhodoferax sp.]MBP9930013.1 adenylate/guanylate cyclase domain-containing protein [Rhodoferax sp.]HQZ04378.1 adenylate/guanylate cyclase domain-containing protein [Burkholderiaceae bacterium]